MNLLGILGAASGGGPLLDRSALGYTILGVAPLPMRVAKLFRGVTIGAHDTATVARIRSVNERARCGHDALCVLAAGLWDLRGALAYREDPEDQDRYAPYADSLALGYADCSSMSVAMCTHGLVSGLPVGACTIAQRDQATGTVEWDHVYSLALAHGRRIACDVSEKYVPVGWEAQAWRVRDKRDWWYDAAAWERWWRAGANDKALPAVPPSQPL